MIYTQNLKLSVPKKIVLIGASTGGPGQIEKIIRAVPQLYTTSIIVAQHMAVGFIPSFAKRLQEYNSNKISVIQEGDSLISGEIYFACGNTSIKKSNYNMIFSQEASSSNSFNPDINVLFSSFAPLAGEIELLSVILTGIGSDGVDGCKNLSLEGSTCVTESEKSAIVDGMPSSARKEVPNIIVADIDKIVEMIREFCS